MLGGTVQNVKAKILYRLPLVVKRVKEQALTSKF